MSSENPSLVPDIGDLKRASNGRIRVSRFDVVRSRERTRSWAVFALGALFAAEVLFMLTAWAMGRPIDDLRDIATIVLGPTVTLLGTALGFYFSSRD